MHAKFMLGLDAFPCIVVAADPPPAASLQNRERTIVTRWGYYAPPRRESLLRAAVGNAVPAHRPELRRRGASRLS